MTTHYLPDLLTDMKEPRKGHLNELERRAQMSFAALTKLQGLPNLAALRLRLNEKQFAERLSLPQDRPRRLHIINEQRKLRANFAGAILATHQVHYEVKSTWDYMAILLPNSSEDYVYRQGSRALSTIFLDPVMGNSAALALMHKQYCPDPDATARLMDSVPDLEKGTIQLALRSLFEEVLKAEEDESFAEPLELSFIQLPSAPKSYRDGLEKAYADAVTIWDRYEAARSEYISAKANLNEPQFANRLEQAIRSGNPEKERQVEAEHNHCQVAFYCAVMACNHFFDRLTAARDQLQKALEATVQTLNNPNTVASSPFSGDDRLDDIFTESTLNELFVDKVRNNCICARVLVSKMDKPGPRPDMARLDEKIFSSVRNTLDSFGPLLSRYRAAMLSSLG